MLKPWPVSRNHEELFMQRYQWLMGWALRLTDHNREQAEDLVHDCFVHFTIARPRIEAIEQNLEGYLYTTLRNMHLSYIRRATRHRDTMIPLPDLSLLDYDSIESGLKAIEQQAQEQLQIQVRDELRRICEYACLRKDTSRIGSVMLLRFFHGYYPTEIAQIMKTTRGSVDELLRQARVEARSYLSKPQSLGFLSRAPTTRKSGRDGEPEEFLSELLRFVWNSRQSNRCFPVDEIRQIYDARSSSTLTTSSLAHIVSCQICLDEVNRTLGLPLLAGRYPMKSLGRQARSKEEKNRGDSNGGGPSMGGAGGTGGSGDEFLKRSRKRRRDVLTHHPKELRISVNGFVVGSHQINSRVNKQSVSVNLEEKIGFVEVFSERDVRLLFCNVEMPPDGPAERRELVELSEGRTLDLALSFDEPWPALEVTYCDPAFEAAANESEALTLRPADVRSEAKSSIDESALALGDSTNFASRSIRKLGQAFRFRSPDWTLLLRPGVVTVVVAILVTAALLLVRWSNRPLTAPDVLARSIATEDSLLAASPDIAFHRTITLEERRVAQTSVCDGCVELVASRKIDIWQSASSQTGSVRATRVFDDKNQLVAGVWSRRDQSTVLYQHGAKPQVRPKADDSAVALLDSDSIWRLEPSAKTFESLVGKSARTSVEERPASYLFSYSDDSGANALVRASLLINKTDLHATEQTLVVRRGDGLHEYHFVETGFARHPVSAVAPSVFEPDPSVLGSETRPPTPTASPAEPSSASANIPASPIAATPELELEVVSMLNQANALSGEQISVYRAPGGPVTIEGIVETDGRKREIVKALEPVAGNPAVRIDVATVAEAAKRQIQTKTSTSPVTINQVEVNKTSIPADGELRSYLSNKKSLSGEQLEQEIHRYSDRVLSRSLQARLQALALKQIVERFSPDDLRALSPEARAKWLAMVHDRARSVLKETAALRHELEPLFPSFASGESAAETEVNSNADLVRAVRRLYELAAATDEAVGHSFSVYVGGSQSAPVKQAQFWKRLSDLESLARGISQAR